MNKQNRRLGRIERALSPWPRRYLVGIKRYDSEDVTVSDGSTVVETDFWLTERGRPKIVVRIVNEPNSVE